MVGPGHRAAQEENASCGSQSGSRWRFRALLETSPISAPQLYPHRILRELSEGEALTRLSDSDLRDHYTAQIPEWLLVCGLTALALFIGAAGTVVVHFVRERL